MTSGTAKLSIGKVATQPPKRAKQYTDGIKRGLLNTTADTLIRKFADPVAAKFQPFLNNLHPGLQILEEQTKSAVHFGMLLAIAEIIAASGKILAKIPGTGLTEAEAIEKCEAFSEYLREYAGEKMGMSVAELAISVVPIFMEAFKGMDPTELLGALGQNQEQEQQEEQAQPA